MADQRPSQEVENLSRQMRLSLKIAHHVSICIPWSDMSALMMGISQKDFLGQDSSISSIAKSLYQGENGKVLTGLLTDLAISAREDGLSQPISDHPQSNILDAWNMFQDGDDDAAGEGPVLILQAAISSELFWAANSNRYRAGLPKPHHAMAPFNRDVFEGRLRDVVSSLKLSLSSGSFHSWYAGAMEKDESEKLMMISLQNWQPVLRRAKSLKARTWSDPEMFPPRPDEASFDLSL